MVSLALYSVLSLSLFFPLTVSGSSRQCDWPSQPQQLLGGKPASCPQEAQRKPAKLESGSESRRPRTPFCVSGAERKYCTQPIPNFRSGRGLSVIATPKAAEAAHNALSHARKAPNYPHERIAEVRDVPGKGKGLVAKHRIKKGRIIMLDSPRIIASAQLPLHVGPSEGHQLFNSAVEVLPKADRELVLSLDKHMGTGVEDIMETNAFACQLDDAGVGDGYMCLFPSVSRINHACRPNAHARFIPRTLLMEIKAQRDIAAGEEITISYGPIDMVHAQRQNFYNDGWHFTCACDLCAADPYAIAGSDQRRTRFAHLREKLNSLTAETYNAQQILAWEKEVLELSQKEGLELLVAEDMERMAYVYSGLGQRQEARMWAKKARESLVSWTAVDGGPNNELARVEELLGELGG